MTRQRMLTLAVLAVLAIGLAALIFSRLTKKDAADSDPTPTAAITTAPARAESVAGAIELYGVVQADPAGAMTIAAPRAVVVGRVLVQAGQSVRAGQALMEVADAPASALAYRQAADAAPRDENGAVKNRARSPEPAK
jgi:multidrug efflux pump subunit AcrA (membrane-fusion protein)